MHHYASKFEIGDLVYVVTDPDQDIGIIIEVRFTTGNQVIYIVSRDNCRDEFYEFELSREINQELKLNIRK